MTNGRSSALSQLAKCANQIADFLALNDFTGSSLTGKAVHRKFGRDDCDVILLCGNSVLATAEASFAAVRDRVAGRLLIAGGIGHSTEDLYQAVRAHLRYRDIEIKGQSEAELLAEIGMRFWGLDPEQIIVETESRNSGENARFAMRLIQAQNIPADAIIIVQDPTMQRRMDATVRKIWQERGISASFANFPVFTPRLVAESSVLLFSEPRFSAWSMDRFLSLLLGEVPRLREYGTQGRGFILDVAVPSDVLQSHMELANAFPHLARTI